MTTLAFIGLGNMGGPMAANLVKAGHRVLGFDLVDALRKEAEARGVALAASARAAVSEADVVVTMLPAGRHVLSVWEDVLSSAKRGALFIDSSTIDVDSARRAHQGATLTFLCGGAEAAFAAARPILEKMGKRIVHCGEAGAGQAAKICNNMILGATMIVTCEAFVLAEKLGLSPQALFDVASTSSGQSWSLTSYCPVPGPVPASPANSAYRPGFAAALMLKDLKLAQEAALAAGASTPLGAEAAQLYGLFAAAGHAGDDFSGIINFLRGAKAA
jgi:3-hydroxyisobutyrate dehydrogenase